ncbi:hypothetical protein CYMTET_47435 [Cymbomonas tetramitiformis]|uniref:protein-serine/threonine phosphatase n=1 Tax=Cymbomonas tetramitiformis TaxID=36881 RepID=A0AAE0BW70_9CHLO|nr:hypothetical protein CYMTET_47435 [Cymbomonas tetramitiformis]
MGAYLSQPVTDKESDEGESANLKYGVAAMQGWRCEMEDAHLAQPNFDAQTSLFGVFDGHGGKEVAAYCARHLPSTLLENESYLKGEYSASLQETYLKMDTLLVGKSAKKELAALAKRSRGADSNVGEADEEDSKFEQFRENQARSRARSTFQPIQDTPEDEESYEGPTAGCTAVVALLKGRNLYVANSGDSRCVLSRGGKAEALSEDHKPTDAREEDRINKAGGAVLDGRVNGSLNLSRAIGDMEFKRRSDLPPEEQMITAFPDIMTATLAPGTDKSVGYL